MNIAKRISVLILALLLALTTIISDFGTITAYATDYKSTDEQIYTLNVSYFYEDFDQEGNSIQGARASATYSASFSNLETYSVAVPTITGYYATLQGNVVTNLTGILTDDTDLTVIYKGKEVQYQVNHNFIELDASSTLESEMLSGKIGEMTKAVARVREGYTASEPLNQVINDENVIIDINYKKNQYYITFETNGGSYIEMQEKGYGDSIDFSNLTTPVKQGYAFDGWYATNDYTGNKISGQVNVTENAVYFAKWIPAQTNYTVIYWQENANDTNYTYVETEIKSGTVGDVAEYDAKDYNYFGFHHADETTIDPSGNTVVNVYYSRNSYTVTFDLNIKDTPGNITMTIGGKAYKKTGDKYSFTAKYESNISSLWPTVENISPNNSFQGWDGIYGTLKVSKRLTLTADLINVTGARIFHPKWNNSLSKYFLHYMFESLDNTSDEGDRGIYKGKKYLQSSIYSQVAYSDNTFSSKDITGLNSVAILTELKDFDGNNNQQIDVYLYYNRNLYTLDFFNAGNIQKREQLKYGSDISTKGYTPDRPANLSEYYEFAGWYTTAKCLDGSEFNFEAAVMPSNNMVLYAKWEAPQIEVNFNTNNGSAISSQTIIAGETVMRPSNPERNGFVFVNWYTDNAFTKVYDFARPVTQTTTIYAKWKPIITTSYTIQYLNTDGTSLFETVGPFTGNVGQTIVVKAKTHNEYIPDTMYKSFKLGSNASSNLIIFHYSKPSNLYYKTKFMIKGTDVEIIPSEVKTTSNVRIYESAKTIPGYEAEKKSISFNLANEGSEAEIKDNIITFYYIPAEYSISYNLNGGLLETGKNNPVKYYVNSNNITLENPQKKGYTFVGWTGTELSSRTMTVVINKGSMGTRSYIANYEKDPAQWATISFIATPHGYFTNSTDSKINFEVLKGTKWSDGIVIPEVIAADGYQFNNMWAPELPDEDYLINSTMTFTAKFKRLDKILSVEVDNTTTIYDGQEHDLLNVGASVQGTTFNYTINGVAYTSEPTFKDAGEYTVTIVAKHANYEDASWTGTVTVGKRVATITVDANQSKVYGIDDPAFTGSVSNLLVKSAEAGIKLLLKKNIPDLILLDINMPEMDGFEAIKKIKQIEGCEEIPVVFLTSMDESVSEIKGLELGAVDYVTKPFVKEILLLRIAKHLTVLKKSKELFILKQSKEILEFDVNKIQIAEKY